MAIDHELVGKTLKQFYGRSIFMKRSKATRKEDKFKLKQDRCRQ